MICAGCGHGQEHHPAEAGCRYLSCPCPEWRPLAVVGKDKPRAKHSTHVDMDRMGRYRAVCDVCEWRSKPTRGGSKAVMDGADHVQSGSPPSEPPWQERIVKALGIEGSPLYLGEAQVWAVASKSDPMKVHYILRGPGIEVCTDCEGFRYRGKCYHLGLDLGA